MKRQFETVPTVSNDNRVLSIARELATLSLAEHRATLALASVAQAVTRASWHCQRAGIDVGRIADFALQCVSSEQRS